MNRTSRLLLALAALVLAFVWHRATPPTPASPSQPVAVGTAAATPLPPEVATTLALIARGRPFPYAQDGVVFGNHEHRLPAEPRGYYHEYTVPTPGARNRGARRIITGGTPPAAYWYTGDHYRSFEPITPP